MRSIWDGLNIRSSMDPMEDVEPRLDFAGDPGGGVKLDLALPIIA